MTKNHAWGAFYCPAHDYATDHRLIEAMQPAVITIQDGGAPHYDWIRKAAPNAIIVARDWSLGDQWSDLERDPEGTGKHHAEQWAIRRDKLKFDPERTFVAPVNEPRVWSDLDPNKFTPEQREAERVTRVKKTNIYNIAFAHHCETFGLRAGTYKFSVGWPGDHGYKDSPINWEEYITGYQQINWKRHCMILHEYFANLGPAESWGWWCGRARKMPWDIPYIIGEAGLEQQVKQNVSASDRGWTRQLKDDATSTARQKYAAMMRDYCNWMAVDPRLLGITFFMLDHQDPQWSSQDYSACWQEIIAIKPQLRPISSEPFVPLPLSVLAPDKLKQPTAPPVVVPPPTPPPPVVTPAPTSAIMRPPLDGAPTVTQWFGENPAMYAQFGYRGHNGIDYSAVVGTPIRAVADGTVVMVDNDPTGYGLYVRLYHKALGIYSMYGHMSKQNVVQGATVKQGDVIGLSGNTGNSTGPHLHYELRLCDAAGNYSTAPGTIGKAATDPVGFIAGLDRGAALAGATGGYKVMLPFVSA